MILPVAVVREVGSDPSLVQVTSKEMFKRGILQRKISGTGLPSTLRI